LAIEIELKTHVKDSEALKLLLSAKAEYLWAFEKEDAYYFPVGNSSIPKSGVRLRGESKTLPDGTEKKAVYVTYKTKEVRDGIEINDEKEFEVFSSQSSPGPVRVFDEFLTMLGLKPGYTKRKKGWAFFKDGINAELLEVEKLGWFLETEIVVNDILPPDKMEITIGEGRRRLMKFLSDLGIEKDAIENRYYSEMLKAETLKEGGKIYG
jgi:adenylate cyclase class 2